MSEIAEMLSNIKGGEEYGEMGRVAQYLCNVVKNARKPLADDEIKGIKEIALDEIARLTQAVTEAKSYRDKDSMFFYGDGLLGLITLSCDKEKHLTESDIAVIRKFVKIIGEERTLENAVDEMFKLKSIGEQDIAEVLDIARSISDGYHRGMLYKGLHEYCDKIRRFTPEAKAALVGFVAADMSDMLKSADSEVAGENLEFAVDVCKHFITDDLLDILERAAAVCGNNVRFYAAETLLNNDREVSGEVIAALAADLCYAELTYSLLVKHGKQKLFPPEFTAREYLAKSDMVHWLTYPTELGRKPDEIHLLGKARVKKEDFYIFKYRSDSSTLSEDLRGEWLIGWSNPDGGTFSNFDKLSDYTKKTPEKTVKYIAKKLLK